MGFVQQYGLAKGNYTARKVHQPEWCVMMKITTWHHGPLMNTKNTNPYYLNAANWTSYFDRPILYLPVCYLRRIQQYPVNTTYNICTICLSEVCLPSLLFTSRTLYKTKPVDFFHFSNISMLGNTSQLSLIGAFWNQTLLFTKAWQICWTRPLTKNDDLCGTLSHPTSSRTSLHSCCDVNLPQGVYSNLYLHNLIFQFCCSQKMDVQWHSKEHGSLHSQGKHSHIHLWPGEESPGITDDLHDSNLYILDCTMLCLVQQFYIQDTFPSGIRNHYMCLSHYRPMLPSFSSGGKWTIYSN